MGLMRRFINIIIGLLLVISSLLIFIEPELGLYIALFFFTAVIFIFSIRTIVYYIRLARHMVGGQIILFIGIFTFCVAAYAVNIQNAPVKTISVIMIVMFTFTGVIDLLRAREAKRGGAGSWKFSMASAIVEIILAVACQVFHAANTDVTGIIFGIALLYSGVSRIISALRKVNWHKIIKGIAEVN